MDYQKLNLSLVIKTIQMTKESEICRHLLLKIGTKAVIEDKKEMEEKDTIEMEVNIIEISKSD